MKLYLAGKMRGQKFYAFPQFDYAKADLEACGHVVVSPADLDRETGFDALRLPEDTDWTAIPKGFDFEACRRRDLVAIDGCEAIVLLVGWRDSLGAKAELAYALWAGKDVYTYWPDRKGPEVALTPYRPGTGSQEVRVVDPKTGGAKGQKLARFDLLPWDALWAVAELFGRGSVKYGDRNWEKGYKYSLTFGALHRHTASWWNGEDIDPETGSHHAAAMVFHSLVALAFYLRGAGTDDRPGKSKP
jgi:hypothetical protein